MKNAKAEYKKTFREMRLYKRRTSLAFNECGDSIGFIVDIRKNGVLTVITGDCDWYGAIAFMESTTAAMNALWPSNDPLPKNFGSVLEVEESLAAFGGKDDKKAVYRYIRTVRRG